MLIFLQSVLQLAKDGFIICLLIRSAANFYQIELFFKSDLFVGDGDVHVVRPKSVHHSQLHFGAQKKETANMLIIAVYRRSSAQIMQLRSYLSCNNCDYDGKKINPNGLWTN